MDQLVSEPVRSATSLRCERCGRQPRLAHQMLDSRKSKTFRMLVCECCERSWDD
jgi:hypothetical protein